MTPLTLAITDLSHDGRGVARNDAGKTVFVTGALPGERVTARQVRKHRQFDEAETIDVLEPSPDRVAPGCAHFGVCGGCALQHLSPAAQIAAKQRTLIENLERIGHVSPARVLPPLVDAPFGYRRRGRLSVRYVDKKEKLLVGFREANGKYVADIASCPVLHPAIGTRIATLAATITTMAARRDIPQIEFAVGDDLAAIVVRHLQPLSEDDRAKFVAFAQETGIAVFLQPGGLDSVVPLHPADVSLSFTIPGHDVSLAFQPLDFIQVNAGMNAKMIDHALALLAPTPEDRVLDLYCGLGNFTLPIARRAKHVVGVEGEAGLVQRARDNATRNGITNAEFFSADLSQDQRDAAWARRDYELILLDPARAGAEQVLAYLPKKTTRRVVYVSCHPASLARDAGILVRDHKLKLVAAGVMDMFPHTGHVESVALFER